MEFLFFIIIQLNFFICTKQLRSDRIQLFFIPFVDCFRLNRLTCVLSVGSLNQIC